MTAILYAEDVGHYWKTGQSPADSWIDKAKKEIQSVKGKIVSEAFGSDSAGRSAFMLEFVIGDDPYKLVWRILPSKTGNDRAAKIQAATMLYHDVKARCMSALVLGVRSAFLSYLILPSGIPAAQAAAPELAEEIPRMFGVSPVYLLTAPGNNGKGGA